MPSGSGPVLGSLSLQSPSPTTQIVSVSRSTCLDIGSFKDLLREYRKLDDSITMRLNRENAMVRDQERSGRPGKGSVQDQACANLWQELVSNWNRRKQIISYCVDVVDQSKEEKQKAAQIEEDPARRRALEAAVFSDDVKATQRNQVHNELSIDTIVRNRSLQAFHSRCRYFTPPLSDSEARKYWDTASS
ncbi:caffeine-induced death protein 2-domain-containing protein [Mycena maculata]|uniref:Caffeine-induced death protein 2-domain-containing protein n=1 Tax=Mycena maculata TaxID=230809 RepID=A0AAD7NQM2_9AGAR|nr:caffeine-induced death protein 2-domain-containing protein [Mycena maculata]